MSYFLQPGTYMGYADIGAALHRISRLRMPHAAHDEFLNAALEVHPLLAKYALNRLLVAEAPPDDDFVQRLLAARDSPEIDTEVALLASRLLSRLTEKPPLNRDEYVWLKTRLMAPTTGRPKPLQPFIRRILEYSDERAETIELFVNIGLGADFPDETRLACMDALIEPEVFKYDHPDVHSHTIVRALLQLLEHDTTKLRGGITGALWKMGMHVSHLTHVNTELREILEEIATALRDAVKRESVVGLRILMTNALARISRGTDVSAHEEDG
ncbi:MAG: hypothetical protein U1E05_15120 [Patescibacteria group bacterium]|nr:hypothetical protein [Patescibacteria group bacterium]